VLTANESRLLSLMSVLLVKSGKSTGSFDQSYHLAPLDSTKRKSDVVPIENG
jgi:hypothetical protein